MAGPRRRGGRPVNPRTRRTTLFLDPDLKRRAAVRALAEGTSLHEVVEAALQRYLKRGAGR